MRCVFTFEKYVVVFLRLLSVICKNGKNCKNMPPDIVFGCKNNEKTYCKMMPMSQA